MRRFKASLTKVLLTYLALCFGLSSVRAEQGKEITRLGFGSCARQNTPQPIWETILRAKPEVFLMIGDNIYGDSDDMSVLRAKYATLGEIPSFKELRKSIPVLATWDDHDFGRNDVGEEFPMKKESQQVFLDFWGVPKDSPRRKQEGVYHSETFGPAGKRVQIILLDTRYHRSPLKKSTVANDNGKLHNLPHSDTNSTILGAAQWKWLEEQLRKPAEVRLIASSIQVVSEDHPWEKWMNFPHERQRLFGLIKETKANGVVFLSGDRHLAELSMMDGGIGYPTYDLTASGLNQAAKKWRPLEVNTHRVATMNFDDHFGFVDLNWTTGIVSLQIRDVTGDIRIQQKIPLALLQHPK